MRKGEHKFDRDYENKIVLLAENRIKSGNYIVLDEDARIVRRIDVPEGDNCLLFCTKKGQAIVVTSDFEQRLDTILSRTRRK